MIKEPICEIDAYKNKKWWLNNKLHRVNGPAIEWSDGVGIYYLYGKCYNNREYKEEIEMLCICFNY